MSRREDIDNEIWGDPEFSALGAHAKLLYLWTFTNPYCGMSGVYKVSQHRMAWEMGVSDAEGQDALQELQDAHLVVYIDGVLWVRSRVKHLRSRSPQMARSIAKDIQKFAVDHPIRIAFLQMYERQPWLREQLEILIDEVPSTYISPKVRAAVLERDGHACVDCGATDKLTMDHVTPRSHGGKATVENLATRCGSCNSRKGVKPNKRGVSREVIDPIYPNRGRDPSYGVDPLEVPGQGQRQVVAVVVEVEQLNQRLADYVRSNDPKANPKPESERWRTDMRLLLADRNGDAAEIERVIDWCQSDSFWRSNILSPAKLRKQFTQLVIKAKAPPATRKDNASSILRDMWPDVIEGEIVKEAV